MSADSTVVTDLPAKLPESYPNRLSLGYLKDSDKYGNATVQFLSGAQIHMTPTSGIDFEQKFKSQQYGNTMWVYSLFALRVLGEALRQGREELRPTWERGWRSAFEKYGSLEGLQRANSIPSADHAAATRLHACLEAAEIATEPGFRTSLAEVAHVTLEWICDDRTYRPNNHGLMTSIALLAWHVAVERPLGDSKVKDIAVRRIIELAEKAFDDNGMCDENTVGYHNFNLRCYDQVMQLQAVEHIDEAFDRVLRPILERADVALGHCMLQDNTVPTVGDSARVKVNARPSINASGDYSLSGFGVIKDERLYLSMICGGRSEIHKHHDDTSLTLWYDGQPLIVDAGSYLYDRTNPYRVSIESSYGHSGIFVEDVDGMMRHDMKKAWPGYASRLDRGPNRNGSTESMTGSYDVPERLQVARNVTVYPDRWIVVRDTVRMMGDLKSATARQRWLLGPKVAPERLGHGHWACTTDDRVLTVMAIGAFDEDIYRAETFDRHRGWYSDQSGVKHPVYGLDFVGRGLDQEFTTVLHIGDRAVADRAETPECVLRAALSG
ncbi:heparinase II/III family protein [Kocuria atrinae]|uniref:heparinase II/III domain-containing protein n=1 Tax=Kocuria atrinae TaxID=592377 RepID=UPI00031BF2A9|nr:heparinase II/III family protein [Kocuria atrinae]